MYTFKVKHKLTEEVVTAYSTNFTPPHTLKFLVFKEGAFSDNGACTRGVWTWVHAKQYEPLDWTAEVSEAAEVVDSQPGTLGGDLGWF